MKVVKGREKANLKQQEDGAIKNITVVRKINLFRGGSRKFLTGGWVKIWSLKAVLKPPVRTGRSGKKPLKLPR